MLASASRRGALLAAACRSVEQRNPCPLVSDAPVRALLQALLHTDEVSALERHAQQLSFGWEDGATTAPPSLVDLHAVCTHQLE
jgi:hypothetical protein